MEGSLQYTAIHCPNLGRRRGIRNTGESRDDNIALFPVALFFLNIFFLYEFLHIGMCTACPWKSEKKLTALELELQMSVSHHDSAGNLTQVLQEQPVNTLNY